ncbi:Alpha-xylosidase [Pseudoruegeria aquimaris]|uniref:Alpha-xylosidase n=1 Tax=Pseudoruegeria aquimaris TaxID=393663 RepID=A0A1Y5TFZ5_9RHOB|nr:glycoside hydrolase family 31 protein [Pseudoruegeria aquimaris]SLN59534.1 Alpha-xylosidase [Pseudoruegeria aquimaris]
MKALRLWEVAQAGPEGLTLRIDGRHLLRLEALEADLIRVSLLNGGAWRNPRTWSIAPQEDVPWEGRSRDSRAGFGCPALRFDADTATAETDRLRVKIHAPLALEWHWRPNVDAPWQPLMADRPEAAYMLGTRDHRNSHFLRRHAGERIFGLGEKTGPLERTGRRFEMRNLDALGYDARSTDPLYKHIPFTLTAREGGRAYGLFYDNLSTCWFDLGNELDNYHPAYRAYRAQDGDLQYYVMAGAGVPEVVARFHRLIGGTAFMPLWGLGYSGSSMALADAPDGQAQIEAFLARCRSEGIPLDSFQMSSGYTTIGPRRYVFNWNTDRFPDPEGMAAKFAAEGVELIANIKPVLLDDHPRYAEAEQAGLFVKDGETGAPETSAFWDGRGSHLDMTNPATLRWWRKGLREALLERGIGNTWNDNNEYEVWEDAAQCAGFGEPMDIALIRPLHGMLMTRASSEEQKRHRPQERPYLISRCAAPGTQRYAQTWTGDNRTGWETLQYNIPMALGLGLSGFFNIGHDVGGFAGPPPGPELFLRWVQNGIFSPRFTIHSWNDDATSNVPWMHPELAGEVKAAIHLRYRLMPYLYTQLYRAVTEGAPILRPRFYDFPADATCWEESFDMMVGPDLLVANVVEPGAERRAVYLPDCAEGWWDHATGQWHAGGQWLDLAVDLASIPLFVRGGTVLPVATAPCRGVADTLTARALAVFPSGAEGTRESLLYEDDGVAVDALAGNHALLRFQLAQRGAETTLAHRRSGRFTLPYREAEILLPEGFSGTLAQATGPLGHGARLAI